MTVVIAELSQKPAQGLSGLSAMMNGTLPADTPPAATPGKDGPAVASTEQALPASGAFSVSALSYTAR